MSMHPSVKVIFERQLAEKERLYKHYCNTPGYDALARLCLSHQIKELEEIIKRG
jgi:hypothetical protein